MVLPIVRKVTSSTANGIVISAGRMNRAVKVRVAEQEWNKVFRKYFPSQKDYLVADPNNSLVEGDVVRIASGHRSSKNIRHVVTAIIAPFGEPVEDRPPILTEEQLQDNRVRDRLLKDVRSAQNGRPTSVSRLARARKQGLEIPSLEEAMKHVHLSQNGGAQAREGQKATPEAHQGQAGQMATQTARRTAKGADTREERLAKQDAKRAQS